MISDSIGDDPCPIGSDSVGLPHPAQHPRRRAITVKLTRTAGIWSVDVLLTLNVAALGYFPAGALAEERPS